MPYVNTVDNHADFFTKALDSKQFFVLRDRIMNVAAPTCEDDPCSDHEGVLFTASSNNVACTVAPARNARRVRFAV